MTEKKPRIPLARRCPAATGPADHRRMCRRCGPGCGGVDRQPGLGNRRPGRVELVGHHLIGQTGTQRSANSRTRAPVAPLPEEEAEGEAQAPAAQPGITTPPSAAPAPSTAQAPSTHSVAPQQAPLVGSGRSHTQSGGS